MKDKSSLFRYIDDSVYEKVYNKLVALRTKYPSYRDDQLLMFMLCNAIEL